MNAMAGERERKQPEGCVIAGVYLTDREYGTLRLIGEGLSNKEIAVKLGISEKMVEKPRGLAMRKIGARSVVDVVRWTLRNGVVTLKPQVVGEEWRSVDMTMKTTTWVCIGWRKGSGEYVCKQLVTKLPITQAQAVAAFKRQCPDLRNYTAQPGQVTPPKAANGV